MSLSVFAHLENHTSELYQLFLLPLSLYQSYCGGVSNCYILPVLWITSRSGSRKIYLGGGLAPHHLGGNNG